MFGPPLDPETWTCAHCEREVPWGFGHVCPKRMTTPETVQWRMVAALERIADTLERMEQE